MIILDTNVVSSLMREVPDSKVVAWLDRQPRMSVWIASITAFEIQVGIEILEHGKRRSALAESFNLFLEKIDQRITPLDLAAARQAASLSAERRRKGRPVDLRDTLIAGIALAQHATLATRNTSHFDDIPTPVINPWTPE